MKNLDYLNYENKSNETKKVIRYLINLINGCIMRHVIC